MAGSAGSCFEQVLMNFSEILKIFGLSKDSWGVHMENARSTACGFEHLKFLDFQVSSSFKKKCPKVGLASNTGRGRDPVLSPF